MYQNKKVENKTNLSSLPRSCRCSTTPLQVQAPQSPTARTFAQHQFFHVTIFCKLRIIFETLVKVTPLLNHHHHHHHHVHCHHHHLCITFILSLIIMSVHYHHLHLNHCHHKHDHDQFPPPPPHVQVDRWKQKWCFPQPCSVFSSPLCLAISSLMTKKGQ